MHRLHCTTVATFMQVCAGPCSWPPCCAGRPPARQPRCAAPPRSATRVPVCQGIWNPGCSHEVICIHPLCELLSVPVLCTDAIARMLLVASECASAPSAVPEADASHQATALSKLETAQAQLPHHMSTCTPAMKSFIRKLSNAWCHFHLCYHCTVGLHQPSTRAPAPPATVSAR